MSWSLCKPFSSCCQKDKVKDTSHFYCGCQANTRRPKMLTDDVCSSSAEIDKQTLITKAVEAIDYEYVDKEDKEEWDIENPTVPFQAEFCDILEANRDIIIYGTVLQNALSFTVNFCKGTGLDADIGFHMNPRFDQFYIPRNCRLESTWGCEEAQTHCKYPFRRGKKFVIEIFLTHNEFLVAINGLHFCAFQYRYPLLEMDTLEIFGNICLHRVQFKLSNVYPNELPQLYDVEHLHNFSIPGFLPENFVLDLNNYDTPHVISIRQSFCIGNRIVISGRVKLLPHSFYINLQQGKQIWPHPVINLHVNVRFRRMTSTGRSVLVNSWDEGKWGSEEFASEDCFFLPGHEFMIEFLCTTDAFHISHNEKPVLVFDHRTDFAKVDTIYIVGDISLSHVSFH